MASYDDAVSMLKDGQAEVFTLGTTAPASSVMNLASARDIRLIGVDEKTLAEMQKINPGYYLANDQGRHVPEAGQGRQGHRLLDAPDRRLRPGGGNGLHG